MNLKLQNYARRSLKEALARCPQSEQEQFVKLYSGGHSEYSIDQVISILDDKQLDWAMAQLDMIDIIREIKSSETTKRQREQVPHVYYIEAVEQCRSKLLSTLQEKGVGTFASTHEILGTVTEEYYEAIDALRANNRMLFRDELFDIAVACIFGISCLDAGTVDW